MRKIYIIILCFILQTSYAQWSLSGNSIGSGNFLGTTNTSNLVFHCNLGVSGLLDYTNKNSFLGLEAGGTSGASYLQNSALGAIALGYSTGGGQNVAMGYLASANNAGGTYNTAIGVEALYKNSSGSYNTALGSLSLYSNTTGVNNSAFGENSAVYNTSGSSNCALGAYSLSNNTTSSDNTAVGYQAAFSNLIGGITAIGYQSLYNNISGSYLVAGGFQALYNNKSGSSNTAVGFKALYANSNASYNTAVGSQALLSDTSGMHNTAFGFQALFSNLSGNYNTAFGSQALYSSLGSSNAAFGYLALYNNVSGSSNTALGDQALLNNVSGNYNVAIGSRAGPTINNLSFTSAIGAGAIPTASNEIVIGSPSVALIGGVVGWSNLSDGRFKKNIREIIPGLEFINQLRPITYNVDFQKVSRFINGGNEPTESGSAKTLDEESLTEKGKVLYTGFIAQEVDSAAKKINYSFSGVVLPQNEKDFYRIRYDDFIPSLVVSVKQLNDSSNKIVENVNDLKNQIDSLEEIINQLKTSISYSPTEVPKLYQNKPNPFTSSTIIRYYIPEKTRSAQLRIINMTGFEIKNVEISNIGYGEFNLNGSDIRSGTYFYSLIINGKEIITKKMINIK